MTLSDTADAAHRAASAAMYGGAGVSAASGGAMYLGLSPGDWQVVGVIGGLIVGVVGLAINTWFKWRHLQLAIKEAK